MTFVAIILAVLTCLGIIGGEPACFSKEGILGSKGQKKEKGFLITLSEVSAFIPTIWPLMALFGVEFSYDIARCIMTLEAFFFFIDLFIIIGPDEIKSNKILIILLAIPLVVSTFSSCMRILGIYAPLSRPIWCILDIMYISARILLLLGVGAPEK